MIAKRNPVIVSPSAILETDYIMLFKCFGLRVLCDIYGFVRGMLYVFGKSCCANVVLVIPDPLASTGE